MRWAAALLVVAALATPAHATVVAPLTVAQRVDASTRIVRGRVTRVWVEVDGAGRLWTRAALDVAEAWKGPQGDVVVDVHGGRTDDVVQPVDPGVRLVVGEDVVVFLAPVDGGRRLVPVGRGQGRLVVRRTPHAEALYAATHRASPGVTAPAYLAPHPPPEARLDLAALEAQVRARVARGWDGTPVPGLDADALAARSPAVP